MSKRNKVNNFFIIIDDCRLSNTIQQRTSWGFDQTTANAQFYTVQCPFKLVLNFPQKYLCIYLSFNTVTTNNVD